jgi:hypothetical protein
MYKNRIGRWSALSLVMAGKCHKATEWMFSLSLIKAVNFRCLQLYQDNIAKVQMAFGSME